MKGPKLWVVGRHGEMRAAAETEQFTAVNVQGHVRTAFEVCPMSGSMCTAEHEAALRTHKLAATANTPTPAIGHVTNPRRRNRGLRPRRLADSHRT